MPLPVGGRVTVVSLDEYRARQEATVDDEPADLEYAAMWADRIMAGLLGDSIFGGLETATGDCAWCPRPAAYILGPRAACLPCARARIRCQQRHGEGAA